MKERMIIAEDGARRVRYADLAERETPEDLAELPFLAEFAYTADSGEEIHGETDCFVFAGEETRAGVRRTVYRSGDGGAEVVVLRKRRGNVLSQTAEIRNLGAKKLCVKKLFNRFPGIAAGAVGGDWLRDVEIGVVRGEWGGEGQLFWENAESLGLCRPTGHKTACVAQLVSPASYTTRKFAPILFFREREQGTVWAIQHLPDGPYVLEIGLTDAEHRPGSCYFAACGAGDSERQGFRLYLGRGKRYRCSETLFTCASCFDESVGQLAQYRRRALKKRPSPPLMFNDYMNCLWCKLGEKECLSLLDAAERAGAEGYCFDDGWYRGEDTRSTPGLGDWIPCDARFGSRTFAQMVKEITSRGLVAGLWTELECCSPYAEAANFPKDWFLTNEGERIFRCGRYYFDLSRNKVREYLLGRIRALYALGIRYIKNDYNGHPGCGCDYPNASPYAGLEQHCRKVHEFYARVGREFPDLILENCASGGMRADARTLENFSSQSISDCEEFEKIPSILNGTLLTLLPEQISVWVYPYPRIFWEMNGESYLTDGYRLERADGGETAFNLVSGFMGNILLSGKIDRADETNFALIQRALALYKEKRDFIASALPVYPLGLARLTDPSAPAAQGLKRGKKVLLAVWRREGEACVNVPMGNIASAEELFSAGDCAFRVLPGALQVTLPARNRAALFEVTLR